MWICPIYAEPVHDKNSNITDQSFDHRTGTPSNTYTYDDLDRLIQADYIDSTDEQFTYDDLDNRFGWHGQVNSITGIARLSMANGG